MSFFFSPQALFGGYPQHTGSVASPFAHPFVQHVATPSPFELFSQPVQHLRHLERGRRHGRSKQAHCDSSPCFAQQGHEEPRQPTVEGRFQVVEHLPDGSIVIRPYHSRADDLRKQQQLELERQQGQKEAEQAAAIAHAKAVCEERCKSRQREYEQFIRELQFEEERRQRQQQRQQQQQHKQAEEAKKQSVEDKREDQELSPRELQKAQAKELLQQLFGPFFDIQFEDDEERTPAVEQAQSTTDVTAVQATAPVVEQEQHVDSEDDGPEFFVDSFASLFGFPFTRPRRRHPKTKRAQHSEQTSKGQQQPEPEQKPADQQPQPSITTAPSPSLNLSESQPALEEKVQNPPTTTTTTATSISTTVGDVEDETPVSDQDDQDNTNDTAYDPYDISSPLIVDVEVQPAQPETKAEQKEPAPSIKEASTTTTTTATATLQTPAVQTSSQQLLARLLAQNEKLFTKRSTLFNKIKLLQNQSTTLSTQDQTQLATLQQHLEQVDALIAQSQTYTDQLLAELY